MILQDKCPKGGRPLNGLVFEVDKNDSRLAYKAGYVVCNCGASIPVSVDRYQIDKFLRSCYFTKDCLKDDEPRKPIKEKIGEWLIGSKQNNEEKQMPQQLPNGAYITR